jgi:hypothetical protein
MTDVAIEPIHCPDLFVDRLVRIEDIGPCRRLVFAVPHIDSYGGPGDRSLVVTARIVCRPRRSPASSRRWSPIRWKSRAPGSERRERTNV